MAIIKYKYRNCSKGQFFMIGITSFFDLKHTLCTELFKCSAYPWDALDRIKDFINDLAKKASHDDFFVEGDSLIISKHAKISPKAEINGPCFIGHGCEIRPFAFIRGNAIIGDLCVIGNSSEIKNSILFDGAKLPHYNYVGDSIIGHLAHMGAGAIASNMKSDGSDVSVFWENEKIPSGRRKLGAIIGDHAEIGCACVLNPGSIIGRNSIIYPNSTIRGYIPENSIRKSDGSLVTRR